jgi:hypothetical protein
MAPSDLLNGQLSDHSTRGTHSLLFTCITSVSVKRELPPTNWLKMTLSSVPVQLPFRCSLSR